MAREFRAGPAQALQQSLDNLFQMIIGQNMERSAKDEDMKAQLLMLTLQNELNQQAEDRKFLKQNQIQLADVDTTNNFEEILDLSGNLDLTETLEKMITSAKGNSAKYNQAINEYNAGVNMGTQIKRAGTQYTESAGEAGTPEAYTLSPDELNKLYTPKDAGGFELFSQDDLTDAYKQGITVGTHNIESALKSVEADKTIQMTNLAIAEKQIDFAEQGNFKLVESLGGSITANIVKAGIPVTMFAGALGGEQSAELFNEQMEAWVNNTTFLPNIKNELISAMQLYASPQTGKINNQVGFVRMVSNAYKLAMENNAKEQKLVDEGVANSLFTAKKMLSEQDKNYADNETLLAEYYSIGLVGTQDQMSKAYIAMQQHGQIDNMIIKAQREGALTELDVSGMAYDELEDQLKVVSNNTFENMFSDMDLVNDAFINATAGSIAEGDLSISDLGLTSDIQDIYAKKKTLEVAREDLGALYRGGELSTGQVVGQGYEQLFQHFSSDHHYQNWGTNRRIKSTGLPSMKYMPTEKELDNLREMVVGRIQRYLNPKGQSDWTGIPVIGLFVPERGAEGVADNIPWAISELNTWNQFIERYNQIRVAQGKTALAGKELSQSVVGG